MKRRDLVRDLLKLGYVSKRDKGTHEIFWHPIQNDMIPIPPHPEINENLARAILKKSKEERLTL